MPRPNVIYKVYIYLAQTTTCIMNLLSRGPTTYEFLFINGSILEFSFRTIVVYPEDGL